MEVLRRCPLAIAQRLVHCAIALSTAVLDRVTKTMSVAPLLTNNLDNSKQKTSNLLSPAPPPYSWSLLGKSEGPAPPPSPKISWSFDLAWNPASTITNVLRLYRHITTLILVGFFLFASFFTCIFAIDFVGVVCFCFVRLCVFCCCFLVDLFSCCFLVLFGVWLFGLRFCLFVLVVFCYCFLMLVLVVVVLLLLFFWDFHAGLFCVTPLISTTTHPAWRKCTSTCAPSVQAVYSTGSIFCTRTMPCIKADWTYCLFGKPHVQETQEHTLKETENQRRAWHDQPLHACS